jgi:hypothetical protein
MRSPGPQRYRREDDAEIAHRFMVLAPAGASTWRRVARYVAGRERSGVLSCPGGDSKVTADDDVVSAMRDVYPR